MKNQRKSHRHLYLTRSAGNVTVKYHGDPTDPAPGIPPNMRYVQVDVDDPNELDRFVGLVLTAAQAATLATRLMGAVETIRAQNRRDVEREKERFWTPSVSPIAREQQR